MLPKIRAFEPADWDQVWSILCPVFRAGETYPTATDISEQDAFAYWIKGPTQTFVAVNETGDVLGTYTLKPNKPSLGAHVCNCGYIVGEQARGQGLASILCKHSQSQAKSMGFRAMQYNLVVSTNLAAVHIWQKNGLSIIGTLPGAFNHAKLGFVDAYVMYKTL